MKTFHQWLEVMAAPPGGPIPGGNPVNIALAQQKQQQDTDKVDNPDLKAAQDDLKKKTAADVDIDIRKAVTRAKGVLNPTNPTDVALQQQINVSAGQTLDDISNVGQTSK